MGSRILVRGDDGILAAQRRLRELGRIRTGWSEPYTKEGRELRRPVRSKTIVLTSAQRSCLDAAADEWGGTVERWQPQGNNPEVWRLITERDGIEAILPPGDPLNQTLEMWSGGGCVRRCDGEVEKLSGKPCLCLAQFGPDFHEVPPMRGVPQVCRPHSRLSVFLDLPDFGLWRIETHSYYAMLEMAGTIDMIKARVGMDVVIPIRLRIDPRVRLANGKPTGYPVIVIELLGRGVVAQILTGSVDGLALEAPTRQAIAATAAHEESPTPPAAALGEPPPAEQAEEPRQPGASEDLMAGLRSRIAAQTTEPDLRDLWRAIGADQSLQLVQSQIDELTRAMWARLNAIRAGTAEEPPPPPPPVEAAPAEAEQEPDRVTTWMQVMAIAGQRGWNAEETARQMVEAVGKNPLTADGWAMDQFLQHLKTGA